uniref:hypothetical protein n=1 Tax=Aeromonas sp. Ne-1 TaxID=1675689 RepID=UPI0015657E02
MTEKANKKSKNNANVKTYKTYKIFPLHHKIFYTCLSVCQRDKITDYLIDTLYHREVSNEIPKWGKAELLDYIVTSVQKKSSIEIEENKDHERIVVLKDLMNNVNLAWDGG